MGIPVTGDALGIPHFANYTPTYAVPGTHNLKRSLFSGTLKCPTTRSDDATNCAAELADDSADPNDPDDGAGEERRDMTFAELLNDDFVDRK
jgi:hypothetical protein